MVLVEGAVNTIWVALGAAAGGSEQCCAVAMQSASCARLVIGFGNMDPHRLHIMAARLEMSVFTRKKNCENYL